MDIFESIEQNNMVELDRNIDQGQSVIEAVRNKYTPLILAVKMGNFLAVQKLIKAGANINVQDGATHSVLMLAAMEGNDEILKLVLDAKPVLGLKTLFGDTALHMAVLRNRHAAVEQLLDAGANPDVQNNANITPLYASIEKNINITRLLLDAGANPDIACMDGEWTPLQRAIDLDKLNAVEALIAANADPHYKCKNGKTTYSFCKNIPMQNTVYDYQNRWTASDKSQARKKQASTASSGISSKTESKIAQLESYVLQRKNGAEAGKKAMESPWVLVSEMAVAKINEYASANYRLTEIFDFETRRSLGITRNLETGAECIILRDFDDIRNKSLLTQAFNAFTKAGGKADPRAIESGYVDRKMESLTRAKLPITSTQNDSTP